ncbi:Hypothetical protein A7982_09121 [Minicystis rosea]|nr:Hypothetical protein A7982_09121 [Minicystis rosea]
MKLLEALSLLQKAAAGDAAPFQVRLACGFTPLHLQTFLGAHLQRRLPARRVVVEVGLFGDVAGTVARLGEDRIDAAVVVLEWSDLDPRLGVRRLGGWRPGDLPDVVRGARASLNTIRASLTAVAGRMPIALSLPSLPLPPIAPTAPEHASGFELELRAAVAAFAAEVGTLSRVRVLAVHELDRLSPPGGRFDARAELDHGHPHPMAHDDVLADLSSRLVSPPPKKKGLITDLDNTLWRGLVGEEGPAGVRWDLDGHAQVHGLYQQVLRALADQGVLLAIASKNERAVVDAALARADLAVDPTQIFPIEAHWGPKSESVARILRAWNVGADSVVFVDDSPLEIAEVQAAFPEVEGLCFPEDVAAAYALLGELRARFAREETTAEDGLRMATLRAGALADEERKASASPDVFLAQVDAHVEVGFAKLPLDPRALELVNKTNQFNLNGRRIQDAEWLARLEEPETILMTVAYRDKFGPLGKIAVVRGRRTAPRALTVDAWVLSCRAFARRVEHRCLEQLFTRLDVDEITLDFAPTPRNTVLAELLAELTGAPPSPGLKIERSDFFARSPPLHHAVSELP